MPQLLPEWPARAGRRLGAGVHLRRLGGPPVLTARGSLPRLRGIEAVRGFCLARRPVRAVELLVDGRVVRTEPIRTVATPEAGGLAKHVFNIWHDFGPVQPGLHRLTVRPVGFGGGLRGRSRRVVVEAPPEVAPDSDAFIPRDPDDARAPEAIVASLPSVAHSARRSVLPDRIGSILVIRADQLGDLVVSVPALLRLRALFPEARVTGLVTGANADFARSLGLFDTLEIATFDGGRMAEAEQARLRDRLAATRFDLAVDFGEGAGSRLLLLLSGAGFRYGFRHGDHAWLSAAFELNTRDPANGYEALPPSRKLLTLVEGLAALRPADPVVLPAPDPGDRLAPYGIAPGERFLLLHAGARFAPSRWPGFGRLAELLLAATPHRILAFTHGGEDMPVVSPRLRVIDRKLPFADFDALLAACAVFVGNDSGPKHLAALRGTRVVSLHMARLNWSEWGQEGQGLILSRRVPCAGCNVGDQPEECGRDYTCLRSITPEEACAAVLQLL